jgi:hypothetical protein
VIYEWVETAFFKVSRKTDLIKHSFGNCLLLSNDESFDFLNDAVIEHYTEDSSDRNGFRKGYLTLVFDMNIRIMNVNHQICSII